MNAQPMAGPSCCEHRGQWLRNLADGINADLARMGQIGWCVLKLKIPGDGLAQSSVTSLSYVTEEIWKRNQEFSPSIDDRHHEVLSGQKAR